MAGKTRSAYSKEFREDAVRLYRSSGKSILTVSKELGIAGESLRKWMTTAVLASRDIIARVKCYRQDERRGDEGPDALLWTDRVG